MGIKLFSSSSYDESGSINPDPNDFSIIDTVSIGEYLIAKIRYPNCTNYEGTKILVFKNVTDHTLRTFKHIDPHFSNCSQYHTPIARFVPTSDGWDMAIRFCITMQKKVVLTDDPI